MYSIDDGRAAVRAARDGIVAVVSGSSSTDAVLPETFEDKAGVFVTVKVHERDELRGCIGYSKAYLPLKEALVRAAQAAATEDPRFPPVAPEELPGLQVEVSLLTPPELLRVKDPSELPDLVRVGTDGLIASRDGRTGLLLPQVAVEWGWDSREFLSRVCAKAGLPPDAWLDPGTTIESFQAEVFEEVEPGGEVVRRGPGGSHAGD